MPNAADIAWFKQQFRTPITAAVAGTAFDLDMITAIACQETGYIWQRLRTKPLTIPQITALCVGDTLDSSGGRRAFPRTKSELVAETNGSQMFAIARQALVDMARHIPDYQGAAANPNKFCHGFGVFQYDLQFFRSNPQYFLQRKYEDFNNSLERCIGELRGAVRKLGWQNRPSLPDYDMACVAIVYNTGGFDPRKGLKQGHFNGTRYYGEEIFAFIRLSRTVAMPAAPVHETASAPIASRKAGEALIAPPEAVSARGAFYVVNTTDDTLRLRSEPKVGAKPTKNAVGQLPDGHPVRAVDGKTVKGFLKIETSLNGAHFVAFAEAKYLKAAPQVSQIESVPPFATEAAVAAIPAAHLPHRPSTVTKRTDDAGALSLNEPRQPVRSGTSAAELCASLAAIIDWLAVEKALHKRYKPRNGLTFCNIYAHDYCHLAGVYLPRVWWTPRAIIDLTRGRPVQPLYGATVDEQRANDLFRWLADFGPQFGWRQTESLSNLQLEVNQGGIGLIVARRRQDGLSGHIVMVVPETVDNRARRNAAGEVIAPLQSQAGAVNFRYGTSTLNWWKDERFADSAFWIHA